MAEVAGPRRVEMYMERDIFYHDHPSQQQQHELLGPILKVDICFWRFKQLVFVDRHGVPRGTPVTRHDIICRAWSDNGRDLIHLLRSANLPTSSYNLHDIKNRILSYANEWYNPRAAMIHVKADVTLFVTNTIEFDVQPPENYYWAHQMDGQIVAPIRRSERDLKERYGFCAASEAAEAGDIVDNLGDCCVCLEDLVVGKLNRERQQQVLMKMPCSHVFHAPCITKWLQLSDSCPICRSFIPP